MVIAILAFVWLTPPDWLGDPMAHGMGLLGWLLGYEAVRSELRTTDCRALRPSDLPHSRQPRHRSIRLMISDRQGSAPQSLLSDVLLLLGAGFLVANVRILVDMIAVLPHAVAGAADLAGRAAALLRPVPRHGRRCSAWSLIVKLLYLRLPPTEVFGEAMMLTYYGYLVPLSIRIGRGFYEDGVWMDNGFLPYHKIGGLSWREGEPLTLLFIPRMQQVARRLVVPSARSTAPRAACSATRSPATTSTSGARRSTSARTTSATTRRQARSHGCAVCRSRTCGCRRSCEACQAIAGRELPAV